MEETIKKIKSRAEFEQIADNWYQRSHRLREVWQDETQSEQRRFKAYRLWNEMYARVSLCFQIAQRLSQPIPPSKFPLGGIKHK